MHSTVYKSFFNWSGGKDSALALTFAMQQPGFAMHTLVTHVLEGDGSVAMHGIPQELISKQAEAIGLPLQTVVLPQQPSNVIYQQRTAAVYQQLVSEGYTHGFYGDIFLEDLRLYREAQLQQHGLKAEFPLWQMDGRFILNEFIRLGFKAIVVCVDAGKLNNGFAGRLIDQQFVNDLPPGVDVCGENGEYHTFVYDGPIFKHPIPFNIDTVFYEELKTPVTCVTNTNETDLQTGYWYTLLSPQC